MYKEITSKENRIYKECLKLSQKKYRDREGKYIIEGENLLKEAVAGDTEIDYIVESENTNEKVSAYDKCTIYRMPEVLFRNLAQTETSQGVIAIVRKPVNSLEKLKADDRPEYNYVILDRLQDPGNIGTVIRTAEGAGYRGVIALKGTADIFSPKVVRSAAGSVFRIPIVLVEDNRELKQLVTDMNKTLAATCFDTDNYYYDADLSEGIALIIGNEGNGIDSALIDASDIKIKIPMNGKLESLNASVAAGILMYEAVRGKKECKFK